MYQTQGYYINCDDALCTDCAVNGPPVDNPRNEDYPWWPGFESWEEPLAISNADESDTPTHCIECGALIEHDLTDEGYRYVAEAIGQCFTEGKQNPVVKQWIDHYGEWLDDTELPQADAVDMRDAVALFSLLPIDREWIERKELRRHAILAGWTIDKETS